MRPQYCIERKVLPSGGFQISELDFPNITQSYHNHMALVLSLPVFPPPSNATVVTTFIFILIVCVCVCVQ